MKTKSCLWGLSVLLVLSSCSSGGYHGYKMGSYKIRGRHYQPMSVEAALHHSEVGMASWYDERRWFGLSRGTTALGERFRPHTKAGAHTTLPLPCRVKVTNLQNGRSTVIRLNDRGPFVDGRILDVTPKVAKRLGFKHQGLTKVRVEVVSVGDGKHKRKRRR
ncbi:MAG: septal ring lytic transglycosylase RlpA family protein [Verrucomicrobiales bacterium]|nr:septal ring lytic transglycosylase RlpA family protein [Verrucomicrobiales bacterium]